MYLHLLCIVIENDCLIDNTTHQISPHTNEVRQIKRLYANHKEKSSQTETTQSVMIHVKLKLHVNEMETRRQQMCSCSSKPEFISHSDQEQGARQICAYHFQYNPQYFFWINRTKDVNIGSHNASEMSQTTMIPPVIIIHLITRLNPYRQTLLDIYLYIYFFSTYICTTHHIQACMCLSIGGVPGSWPLSPACAFAWIKSSRKQTGARDGLLQRESQLSSCRRQSQDQLCKVLMAFIYSGLAVRYGEPHSRELSPSSDPGCVRNCIRKFCWFSFPSQTGLSKSLWCFSCCRRQVQIKQRRQSGASVFIPEHCAEDNRKIWALRRDGAISKTSYFLCVPT